MYMDKHGNETRKCNKASLVTIGKTIEKKEKNGKRGISS